MFIDASFNTLMKLAVEKDGVLVVQEKLTQQDIANMVALREKWSINFS